MKKQILYFNFEDKIFEYPLPALNNRRHSFDLSAYTSYPCVISFEVWDDIWFIKRTDNYEVAVDGYEYNTIRLDTGLLLHIRLKNQDEIFTVMVLDQSMEITEFRKYSMAGKNEVTIGADPASDIFISEEYVSRKHAVIIRKPDGMYIKDSSKNGTFLNGQRLLSTMKLKCFDEIYILGVKLVCLGDMIAVNHLASVSAGLPEVDSVTRSFSVGDVVEEQTDIDGYFTRAPRNMEPLVESAVEIEAPPSNQKQKQQPLLFILGPSVTMPLPIMLSVLFNMYSNSGGTGISMYFGTLISVFASAFVGAMWAIAHQQYNKKEAREAEKFRVQGYKKYISQNEQLLEARHKYNKQLLEQQYLSTAELLRVPEENHALLWNRNVNHKDFLTIRLGKGQIEFPGKIAIPKDRFSLTEDELASLPYELYNKFHYMKDAVSTINLRENKLIGVVGEPDRVMQLAQVIAIQTAALHCYTDVKMAFLYNQHEREQAEWMKWLPHTFSSDKKVRYMAADGYSYQNVLFELTGELRNREEKMEKDGGNAQLLPHFIVFSTEKEILEKEAIYSYMINSRDYGFTFILLYGEMDRLPNECTRIIQCDDSYTGVFALNKNKNATNEIIFDTVRTFEAEQFARKLSGIYVNENSGGEIPTMIDFMEMMQIGCAEQWDLIKHYKENRAYESIRALVGLTHGNKPMYLDIHEKKHGPHGLVAGTTGSGKSETIMTLILSLAMNYHPDEVAFVLIDYKGGGMAAPFIGMPHTAGTITNIGNSDETESIDVNQTRRALISIKSEIRRRQKIFNKYKVNHIDSYIRLYRDEQAEEPVPHLIIISDEFAELKKEQPEFIKELVSAARVGRSLGIHLILATQKPAGVVDDEIWSNSRFKICLRVQDKQDSIGMLKRPEAAALTGTGRAYLQIGNDEIFEMFQSGYAGAAYEPKEEIELSQHNEVSMIGLDGGHLVTPRKKKNQGASSQLDACIHYISRMAEENNIHPAKPLWMPPLPEMLYLEEVEEKYPLPEEGICAVYGLVDQPELQKQYPATIDFMSTASLLIIGNIGMGKTTLLQTILFSLATRYSTEDVTIYCMDFSSRTFKIFNRLPHCGGVAFPEEDEAVRRMISLISEMMDERRHTFEEAGVGSYREYRTINRIPLILLCIDNYAMFKELYDEERLTLLLREGSKYGIQVVVTANGVNDLNYRIRQNFSDIIPLYLGEKGKYLDAFGVTPEFLPGNYKGRGLLRADSVVEFQTALAVHAENEVERNRMIVERFNRMAEEDGNVSVKRVRTIPKEESYENFALKPEFTDCIPLGYNVADVKPEGISFEDFFCYTVCATTTKSVRAFSENLLYACERLNIETVQVSAERREGAGQVYLGEYEAIVEFEKSLKQEFAARSLFAKEQCVGLTEKEKLAKVTEHFGRKVVLIESLADFAETLYENYGDKEKPAPLMEFLLKNGQGLGIYFFSFVENGKWGAYAEYAVYKIFTGYRKGICFGGKLDQQKILDFDLLELPLRKLMKPTDYNVGSFVQDNKLKQIYMPLKGGKEA